MYCYRITHKTNREEPLVTTTMYKLMEMKLHANNKNKIVHRNILLQQCVYKILIMNLHSFNTVNSTLIAQILNS